LYIQTITRTTSKAAAAAATDNTASVILTWVRQIKKVIHPTGLRCIGNIQIFCSPYHKSKPN
jgi:hypothetical protein